MECQTAANRCKKIERNDTGLTETFREFIPKERKEYSDSISDWKNEEQFPDYKSEEDSNYSKNQSNPC